MQTYQARLEQAKAAQSTLAASQQDVRTAEAQLAEAETRLGYSQVVSPVTGIVNVRAAREGEVVNPGQAIVTVVDYGDTWVYAPLPETDAGSVNLGDTLTVKYPWGATEQGKVFYKAAEADFATQRDVSRNKRDIKTIAIKVRVQNNQQGKLVPGMTAMCSSRRASRVVKHDGERRSKRAEPERGDRGRPHHQEVRRLHRRRRCVVRGGEGRDLRTARSERRRQVDADPHDDDADADHRRATRYINGHDVAKEPDAARCAWA